MAEAKKKKGLKNWWAGLKAEFSKIIWPTKASIVRQTVVVVIVTVIMGVLIGLIDQLVQFGLDKIFSF
jgi:preprotein translocase subunit SecE